ncbi:ATP-binding protein [Pollutibacter soli]|uniref:ATP-binding protein n=1 Tax=Pollutibacter soli TaxID=3034157 RepID=UPI003013B120
MMRMQTLSAHTAVATDTILDSLLDAVLVVDTAGIIIYANRSAFELFQKNATELIDHPFGFPVAQYEVQEINVIKDETPLTVQMLASPIEWNGKKASLLSLRDITAQKKLMVEIEGQKALLERKNEENAQYASLASHDLKEPVRKILIFSDLLLSHDGRPSADTEKIQKIHSLASRMILLIDGISQLSRVSHVEHSFNLVDLKQVVDEVCNDLEFALAEKEVVVEVGSLPVIDAVPDKMYQLFLNLISNSIKYARKNVKPLVRITAEDLDEEVIIKLQDNGIGFNNNWAKQLFQPFRRLHNNEYDGVGIGLSICSRIVELHHGEIHASGIEGKGAEFTIRLPRIQQMHMTEI